MAAEDDDGVGGQVFCRAAGWQRLGCKIRVWSTPSCTCHKTSFPDDTINYSHCVHWHQFTVMCVIYSEAISRSMNAWRKDSLIDSLFYLYSAFWPQSLSRWLIKLCWMFVVRGRVCCCRTIPCPCIHPFYLSLHIYIRQQPYTCFSGNKPHWDFPLNGHWYNCSAKALYAFFHIRWYNM